ncbi:MAG: hypothetical protein WBB74_00855 [Gaiellaceae bacterium]
MLIPAIAVGAVWVATSGSAGKRQKETARPSVGIVREGSSAVSGTGAATTGPATTSFGPNVGDGTFDGESPAVSSLPVLPINPPSSVTPRDNESLKPNTAPLNVKDPVVQTRRGGGPISAPIANFDGICLPFGPPCAQASGCGCLPPDTNGEAGLTQYVEIVNTNFAVYSKTGSVLRPSTPINQLWAGTNSECATHNDGDPVVVYDQLANRWLLSQFIAAPSGNEQYGECIAVSTTSDATGSYYRYTFLFGSNVFFDYPKIGVWPDGYYMSANEFPSNTVTSAGAGAFAFERSQMLAGKPARFVFFDESLHNPPGGQFIGQLPGDLDGSTLPPKGQPNIFAEVDDPSSIPPTPPDLGFTMRLWKFHVDWANPAGSTFGNDGAPSNELPVAAFVRPQCVYGYGPNCVPQKGGAQELDTLGDRLMFRLPIRNFGTYESMTLNHTVVADGRNGIRWYEVRIPKGGTPSIYQQGTYAPSDSTTSPLWRWMGSVAMDHSGDLALGYSASGPNDFPSVRYTGRAAGDPLGQLTQTEQVAYTGTGPQTEAEGRWGDYSDLSVDPTDDCTFWYAQEYLAQDVVLLGTWRTRIVSFKFPGCRR